MLLSEQVPLKVAIQAFDLRLSRRSDVVFERHKSPTPKVQKSSSLMNILKIWRYNLVGWGMYVGKVTTVRCMIIHWKGAMTCTYILQSRNVARKAE